MISTEHLSDVFVDVADTLVDDFDLIDFLHTLTAHAGSVSGADAVGLMLADHNGLLQFMASSNESGRLLELCQLQVEEGPCVDSFHAAEPAVNADLASADAKWPRFAPAALQAGFQSVHAFPMRLRGEAFGALNLFSRTDQKFAPGEVRVVQAIADVATIALVQERAVARADALAEQLQGALNTRIIIEQAKGALAYQLDITPDEAFQDLRTRARTSSRLLVDVTTEYLQSLGG